MLRWRLVQDESQSLYELGLNERGEILCEFQVSRQPYLWITMEQQDSFENIRKFFFWQNKQISNLIIVIYMT